MVKKTMVVLCLCVVALSCAFAGKSAVVEQASPYSHQTASASAGDFKSKYGFGFKAGYRYILDNGLVIEADAKYSNFKYEDVDNRYHVISFMAKVGGSQTINKITVTVDLGGGPQLRILGDMCIVTLGLSLYSGVGYAVSDAVSIECGADMGIAFQKNSTDLSIDALLGAVIRL